MSSDTTRIYVGKLPDSFTAQLLSEHFSKVLNTEVKADVPAPRYRGPNSSVPRDAKNKGYGFLDVPSNLVDTVLSQDGSEVEGSKLIVALAEPEKTPEERELHDAILRVVRQAFDMTDTDFSGSIDEKEINEFVKKLPEGVFNDPKGLMDALDTDHDGVVTRSEWMRTFSRVLTKTDPPPTMDDVDTIRKNFGLGKESIYARVLNLIRKAFLRNDKDRNRQLDREELEAFIAKLPIDVGSVEDVFSDLESNKDGVITCDEWMRTFHGLFMQAVENDPDRLTEEDFETYRANLGFGPRQTKKKPRQTEQKGAGSSSSNQRRAPPTAPDASSVALFDAGANLVGRRFCNIQNRSHSAMIRRFNYVVDRAVGANVGRTNILAGTLSEARRAVSRAAFRPFDVSASVGLAGRGSKSYENEEKTLSDLVGSEGVVAVVGGVETIAHEEGASIELQSSVFEAMIDLAAEHKKPLLIVGTDDQYSVVLDILNKKKDSVSAFAVHNFTGSAQQLQAFINLGAYVSFSGLVTSDSELAGTSAGVPSNRLLVASDAPFNAPQTDAAADFQQTNEPCTVGETVAALATAREGKYEDVAAAVADNAATFFGVQYNKGGLDESRKHRPAPRENNGERKNDGSQRRGFQLDKALAGVADYLNSQDVEGVDGFVEQVEKRWVMLGGQTNGSLSKRVVAINVWNNAAGVPLEDGQNPLDNEKVNSVVEGLMGDRDRLTFSGFVDEQFKVELGRDDLHVPRPRRRGGRSRRR